MHGTEGRTGSDASPLHGAARTGTPLRLHGVARMYGCCLTANRTSILQQNLSHRDPNEPGSARPAVRELHSSTDLHGMPDLDYCTELHGTRAAALQASRGCTSLHGSFLKTRNVFQNVYTLGDPHLKIRTLPARHVFKSRTFCCTARKAAQAAMLARCTELHGLARH